MAGDLGKYADESRVSADMSEREREREVLWQILLKKSSREREREGEREICSLADLVKMSKQCVLLRPINNSIC